MNASDLRKREGEREREVSEIALTHIVMSHPKVMLLVMRFDTDPFTIVSSLYINQEYVTDVAH